MDFEGGSRAFGSISWGMAKHVITHDRAAAFPWDATAGGGLLDIDFQTGTFQVWGHGGEGYGWQVLLPDGVVPVVYNVRDIPVEAASTLPYNFVVLDPDEGFLVYGGEGTGPDGEPMLYWESPEWMPVVPKPMEMWSDEIGMDDANEGDAFLSQSVGLAGYADELTLTVDLAYRVDSPYRFEPADRDPIVQTARVIVVQDAVGGHTFTLTGVYLPGGVMPTVSTAPGARHVYQLELLTLDSTVEPALGRWYLTGVTEDFVFVPNP